MQQNDQLISGCFFMCLDGSGFTTDVESVIFQPGSQRECVDVEILDDNIVETPPEETFTIVVTPVEPNPYRATARPNSEVPVTIVDDDGKMDFPFSQISY